MGKVLYVGYTVLSVAGEPDGDPLRRLRLREMFFKCPSLRRGETETEGCDWSSNKIISAITFPGECRAVF